MNVITSVFIKGKTISILCTDPLKGSLSIAQTQFHSAKDLELILGETFKDESGPNGRYKLRLTEVSADEILRKEYDNSESLASDILKHYGKSEIVIQPVLDNLTIIRGCHIPPRPKLFQCNVETENDMEVVKKVSLMKEMTYPYLEDQCKHLFDIFNKCLFNPRNLKLEGIALDFVKIGTITYFLGVHSFRSSILDQNFVFVEGKKGPAKKCYGIFCQSKEPFEKMLKVIKSIRRAEQGKKGYSLLYKDISDYDKLYKSLTRNPALTFTDLLKPFLYGPPLELLPPPKPTVITDPSLSGNPEPTPRLSEPPDFQSMPVCETCYYMYLLHKSKHEKARRPNLAMKKTVLLLS